MEDINQSKENWGTNVKDSFYIAVAAVVVLAVFQPFNIDEV